MMRHPALFLYVCDFTFFSTLLYLIICITPHTLSTHLVRSIYSQSHPHLQCISDLSLKLKIVFVLIIFFPSFPHQATGTYKEIAPWISKKSVPLVGQRTRDNMAFKYENRPLAVVYYDVNFSHQYIKGECLPTGSIEGKGILCCKEVNV